MDAAGDEVHGAERGDELPEALRTPNGRRAWLRGATEELERERAERPEPVRRDRAERLETCDDGWPGTRRPAPRKPRYSLPRPRRDQRRPPVRIAAGALLRARRPRGQAQPTDPDARRLNSGATSCPPSAQAATASDQIIVAAKVTTKGGDFEELDPMIAAAERELATAGIKESPGVVSGRRRILVKRSHRLTARARDDPDRHTDTTRNRPRTASAGPMTSCAG